MTIATREITSGLGWVTVCNVINRVSSLAATIDSGINVAKQVGVTLIGFVRGQRMNIYTFPERIIIE